MALKEKEHQEQQKKYNKAINANIMAHRPNLEIVEHKNNSKINKIELYILPYSNQVTITDTNIYFDYDRDILLQKNNWACYSLILKNTGKTVITEAFIQLPYKSGLNVYSYSDFNFKLFNGYYSDNFTIDFNIQPTECFELKIYYPKSATRLQRIDFNIYFEDKNKNYWLQKFVSNKTTSSQSISPLEYSENLQSKLTENLLYCKLFLSTGVIKKIPLNIEDDKFLNERQQHISNITKEIQDFKNRLDNNEIALNEPRDY